jgi:NAD(P)-dependent dehydrogenase (short-subunit alcohol dehydrogenase family)
VITLEGKRVVVVGGTSGMGLATVRATARLGAEVFAVGRRPVEQREPIAGVRQVEADVTDQRSIRAFVEPVGELDHLFVTAAPGSTGPFLEQELNEARSFMDGKFFGSWTAARYLSPQLRATGSITFVTGVAVLRPPRHGAMIAAAFAAIEALTRALAVELAPRRVNTIRPGYTDSDMWSFLAPTARDELRQRVADAMPVGRMGTPEDIAHAAVFLMTNPQVTGTVLEVSGGESLVNPLDDAS